MSQASIRLPLPPTEPERTPFPLIASVAPVLISLLIWLITNSAFTLLFALLGPVIAVSSHLDSGRRNKRRKQIARSQFDRSVANTREQISNALMLERSMKLQQIGFSSETINNFKLPSAFWNGSTGQEIPVLLGFGKIDSAVRVDDAVSTDIDQDHLDVIKELKISAASLSDSPVVVDARQHIQLSGPRHTSIPIATGVLIQILRRVSPESARILTSSQTVAFFPWLNSMPHTLDVISPPAIGSPSGPLEFEIRFLDNSIPPTKVVVGEDAHYRHETAGMKLECQANGLVHLKTTSSDGETTFWPNLVTEQEASATARRLCEASVSQVSNSTIEPRIPSRIEYEQLDQSFRDKTEAHIGISASGQFGVDLCAQGPHAIVVGTTGSGKSELLTTWLVALASKNSPIELNFLLVDFKGGATFNPLLKLKHTVGLVTDLNPTEASRVLSSLKAEIMHRELVLLDAGVRAFDELVLLSNFEEFGVARLVVVVDEFAALLNEFSELNDLFSDIASRGRSLGMHLILSSQRAAGCIRDSILANCNLRISLRTGSREDSVAVLGTAKASELSIGDVGKAIIDAGNGSHTVQVAISNRSDIDSIEEKWSSARDPRKPWLEPLPTKVDLQQLRNNAEAIDVFGLLDVPERQLRDFARYRPVEHGNIVVTGNRRSGKTTALAALASCVRDPIYISPEIEPAWDEVMSTLERSRSGDRTGKTLILDDLDVLVSRFGPDHREVFSSSLEALATEGRTNGVTLCVSTSNWNTLTSRIADSTLILGISDRHEYVNVNGNAEGFNPRTKPGQGRWQEHQVLVGMPEVELATQARSAQFAKQDANQVLSAIVVTENPVSFKRRFPKSDRIVELGQNDSLINERSDNLLVATAEEWLSKWSLFTALRSRKPVVFYQCTLTDFRSVTRMRALPPPLANPSKSGWLVTPDNLVSRIDLADFDRPGLADDAV